MPKPVASHAPTSTLGRESSVEAGASPRAASLRPPSRDRLRALFPWLLDGLAISYLMTGTYAFDARIAVGAHVSLNQILGLLVFLELLWFGWKRRRHRVRGRLTLTAVILLTTLLFVRSIGSQNESYATFKVLAHLLLILPVLLHMEIHIHTRSDFQRLLQIWFIGTLLLLTLSFPHMIRIRGGERLAILAGGPNVLARLIGTGVLCAFVLFRIGTAPRAKMRWIYIVWLPLAFWALLLTGTKAVFLAIPIALVVLYWGPHGKRLAGVVGLTLVLLGAIPLVAHRIVRDRPKDGGVVRLLRLPDIGDPLGSYGARLGYIRGTWKQIRESPWLGVGTGQWGIHMGFGPSPTYPHNIFLEITAELGCVGLLMVLLPLARLPNLLGRLRHDFSALPLGLLALFLFWAMNVQLSGDLVDSRYLWLFLLLVEIHAREAAQEPTRGSEAPERAGSSSSAEIVT